MKNLQTGKLGERFAIAFLENSGYKILATNYRCPWGEIDIIALHNSVLVFIEVKARCGDKFGTPQSAVTLSKQKKLSQTAQYYLSEQQINNQDCRFDVIAVILTTSGSLQKIEQIPNAFNFVE